MHLLGEPDEPYASQHFALRGTPGLAYVITLPCVGTKDASCIEVCPVDCIHAGDAIYPEDEVPAEWTSYIKLNAEHFRQ